MSSNRSSQPRVRVRRRAAWVRPASSSTPQVPAVVCQVQLNRPAIVPEVITPPLAYSTAGRSGPAVGTGSGE